MQGGKAPRPKKCNWCKIRFQPSGFFIPCCSTKCLIAFGNEKKKKLLDEEHKQRKREFRENDKSIQRKSAQTAFNAFIRHRDKDLGCITCDKPKDWGGQWHAGHYRTVAARPDLRFNEDGCNKQCSECNNFHSGRQLIYRDRLIEKIGLHKVEVLDQEPKKRKHYKAEDYRDIAKLYRQKLKALKNGKV